MAPLSRLKEPTSKGLERVRPTFATDSRNTSHSRLRRE